MAFTTIPEGLSVILRRASVRNYTQQPVGNETIELLLRAAMSAPAPEKLFPWKFIVILKKDMLRDLAGCLPTAKMLAQASAAIVICAVPTEAFAGKKEYATLACTCAGQNILLAAESLGLGAVWTTVYPKEELMEALRIKLGIPADVLPLTIIPIGHPSEEDMPCNKYDSRNIHWEKW